MLMMDKRWIKNYLIIGFFFLWTGCLMAEISFDAQTYQNNITTEIRAKLNSKLEEEIWNLIKSGEAIANKELYLRDQLQPFIDAGIIKNDDQIIKQSYDIYVKYRDASDRQQQLMDDIKANVTSKIMGLDQESAAIVTQMQGLWANASKKLNQIEDATKQIASNPDADYVQILRDYGISGELIDQLEGLEVYGRGNLSDLTNGTLSPEEIYSMFKIVHKGLSSDNPGHKIQALFELGSTFGDKIPVLGDFVKLYFDVAIEMNKAVGRLGEILKERQQGCLGTGSTGHIPSMWEDKRNRQFVTQFPNDDACPVEERVGIYKDIYVKTTHRNSTQLYFWVNGKFIEAHSDNTINDLKDIINWLRRYGYASKAKNVAELARLASLPIAFKELKDRANDIILGLSREVSRINGALLCGRKEKQDLFLNKFKMKPILDELNMDYGLVSDFYLFQTEGVNKIIEERFFKGAKHYGEGSFFEKCKTARDLLTRSVAATIFGKVTDVPAGKRISVQVTPSDKVYQPCSELVVRENRTFIVVVIKQKVDAFTLTLKATGKDLDIEENTVSMAGEKQDYNVVLSGKSIKLESVSISPAESTIDIGETVTYKVIGIMSDGSYKNIPANLISWSGASEGVFKGETTGTFTITATHNGLSCQATVTVKEDEDLEEVIDDIAEEGDDEEGPTDDPCDPAVIKQQISLFQDMKLDIISKSAQFNGAANKFFQEINSKRATPCENNILAYAYYQAKQLAADIETLVGEMKALYSKIVIMNVICNSEKTKENIKNLLYDFNDIGPKIGSCERTLASMKGKLDEYSCDEDQIEENGEQVTAQGDMDPEVLQDGGAMGEVIGDGVDQTGEGFQDEGGQYEGQVVILVWDCGSAKDDIFSVSLTGYGTLGTTPRGARKIFGKRLIPGNSYTVSILTLDTIEGAGTWAISISYQGENIGGGSGLDTGSITFTVPEE